jgi:ATP-dependent protease ClpP protease subunit
MKKIFLEFLQIFFIWTFLCLPSSAEPMTQLIVRDGNTVHFGAQISNEALYRLEIMYNEKPFNKITLSSLGGDYDAGMKIAQMVYKHQIEVFVPKYCASACTFIFFAANADQRDISPSATLGLHNVSFSIMGDIDTKKTVVSVDEAMQFAQTAVVRSAMMISFYSANGIPSDVLLKVSQTYGSGVINIQRSDLIRWGVIKTH